MTQPLRVAHVCSTAGATGVEAHLWTLLPSFAPERVVPVLFGPVIQNAEEAGELVRRGAGWIVTRPEEARDRIAALLEDEAARAAAGAIAREIVLAQRGATERSVAVLAPYV